MLLRSSLRPIHSRFSQLSCSGKLHAGHTGSYTFRNGGLKWFSSTSGRGASTRKSPSPSKLRTFAALATGLAGLAILAESFISANRQQSNRSAPDDDEIVATALLTGKEQLKNATVIFVLGGPGAGKGTQCQNMVRDFHFVHLSAGDLLRAERSRPGSQYGQLIDTYIREGEIVPMEITLKLLENAMIQAHKTGGHDRFLIDGFPRKMDQALAFEDELVESKLVLYFECPDDEMLKRLLKRGETSGRADDNVESIRKRFTTFHETSFPVIQHYDKLGKVRKISCLNSPAGVYNEVRKVLLGDLNLVEQASTPTKQTAVA